jgi:putative ABC transport system permease protein
VRADVVNPLPLVVAEMRRNPLGCAAVVALIAVATAFGVVVSAQERALRAASTQAAARFDLIVGAAGSPTQLVLTTVYLQSAPLDLLPAGTLRKLADESGVAALAPVAVTDAYRGYVIVGTTAAFAGALGLLEGRMFAGDKEAVAGAEVALPLGETFRPAHGSPVENVLEAHEHAYGVTIVGRLQPSGTPWDRALVVPIETVWAMHAEDARDARVPAIVVTPRTVADAYRLRAKYRASGTIALFPAEALLPLYSLLGDVRAMMGAMAVAFEALLIVAVLLIIVAVLAGRRQSVGVLRALGAPPAFVVATVWLEGASLIGLGVAAGAPLGAILLQAISRYASLRTGLHIEASLGLPEVTLLGALFVGGSTLAALPSLPLLLRPVAGLLRT